MTVLRRCLSAGALLAVLLAAPVAQAQLLPSFGLAGGLNFANLSDAATANLDQSVGFHVGVYGDFGFGPIGFRGAVLYVRAGDVEFDTVMPVHGGEHVSVSFIGVPLDLKYRAGLPLVNPYALIGPELRFPLGDISDHPEARSTAIALNIGAGLDVGAIIGPQLFAELRYAFDVTGFVDGDDSIRVSLFYLRIGIGF